MTGAPKDEVLRRFLRGSAVGYGLGALSFAFTRKTTQRNFLRIDRGKEMPEAFWGDLATAYMATIAAVAWAAGGDRRFAAKLAAPLYVAKGVTTALFLYRFATTRRPLYAISAVTDASLLGGTYLLAKRSKGRTKPVHHDNVRQLRTGS